MVNNSNEDLDNKERPKGVLILIGLLLNTQECQEMNYLLRKELDELLFDLKDRYLDSQLRNSLENRYKKIFRIYARIASHQELSQYVLYKWRE